MRNRERIIIFKQQFCTCHPKFAGQKGMDDLYEEKRILLLRTIRRDGRSICPDDPVL